ncbi:MAG TPA: PAS domain-containing protein [Victivallis vadensis]|nr:PAS domain-containing protein [Victivallis vadensis]
MPGTVWAGTISAALPPADAGWWFALFFLLTSLLLGGIVRRQRTGSNALRRFSALCDELPGLAGVVDRSGKLLFRNRNARAALSGDRLLDLDRSVSTEFSPALGKVFLSGRALSFCCESAGGTVQVELQPLPQAVFGVEAVFWTVFRAEELDRARATLARMEEGARLTLEALGDGVIVTDETGRITLMNPAAARMAGYETSKVIGKLLPEIIPVFNALTGKAVPSPLLETLKTGKVIPLPEHSMFATPDGRRIHFSDTVSLIRDKEGAVTGAVLVFRDITREYEQRQQLYVSNSLLNIAAGIADIGYFKCTADGEITVPVAEKYWPRRDGRPVPAAEWLVPEDADRQQQAWRVFMAERRPELKMLVRSDCSGAPRYFQLHAVRIPAGDGIQPGIYGILQDVTATRESEIRYMDSNSLLQRVLDNLPCAVFVKDYDDGNRHIMANQAYFRMLGFSEEEILNRTDFEFHRPEFARKFVEEDRQVIESGRPLDVFEQFLTRNNRLRWVHTLKSPLTLRSGRRLLLGSCVDVSELQLSRKQLSEANRLLNAVLNHLPLCVIAKDPDDGFRCRIWNNAAGRITGISAAAAIGRTTDELLGDTVDLESFHRHDREAMAADGVVTANDFYTDREGVRHEFKTFRTRVELGDGGQLLLSIFLDITEQTRLEEERRNLIAELELHINQERIINSCLSLLVLHTDYQESLNRILQIIVAQSHADRCCVFKLDREAGVIRRRFDYCDFGIEHFHNPDGVYPFPADFLQTEWFKLLENHEIACGDDLSTPEGSGPFADVRGYLQQTGLKSVIVAGIRFRGELWGGIAVDYLRKPYAFTESSRQIMRAAANLVELSLIRREHTRELEHNEYEKQLILDNIQVPILFFDAQGKRLRLNRSASQMLEQPAESSRCDCGCGCVGGECLVAACRRDLQPHQKEFRIGGREYLFTAAALFDRDGNFANVLESAVDITEFNANRRKLEQALEAAQAANRAKSSFLATMSHEFRTPLNAVIGCSELLGFPDLPEAERSAGVKAIHAAGNTLLTLVDDVLELSRLEADQVDIRRQPTDAGRLIGEVLDMFRQRALERSDRLEPEIPEPPPLLLLDRIRLRRILINLVGNAVKFTRNGRIAVRLESTSAPDGFRQLRISVADNGPGIPAALHERIFQPFEQAEDHRATASRSHDGAGLGLAISRRLAEKMGGRIELDSAPGRGSTFHIILERVEEAPPRNIP